MTTIEEKISQGMGGPEEVEKRVEQVDQEPGGGIDFSWFFAKSPEKDLKEYEGHALNFMPGSQGMLRVLRGLEGWFNDLNYAFIDVLVGLVQIWQEQKKGPAMYSSTIRPQGVPVSMRGPGYAE